MTARRRYIVQVHCVAIRDHDGTVYALGKPARHHDVIAHMVHDHQRPTPITGEQGFLLSNGQFVNREQARTAAILAEQVTTTAHPTRLFSEDLW